MRCLFVLDLVILFYLFIFFLGREAHRCANVDFLDLHPLNFNLTLKGV